MPENNGQNIEKIRELALAKIAVVKQFGDLRSFEVEFLGKKSGLMAVLASLSSLDLEQKKKVGAAANKLKKEIEEMVAAKGVELSGQNKESEAGDEKIDVTMPGVVVIGRGHRNPIRLVSKRIIEILASMGFELNYGPLAETEEYNFDRLNIPKDHPARDAWDTFFLVGGNILRTHTSPVQIRTMEANKPPLKGISLGPCFRFDAFDASHSPAFYQCEGFAVGSDITLADLKGTVGTFLKRLFGEDIEYRMRSSYFPFVEPGVEFDISCSLCAGRGCPACKGSGWIEVMGAGMIHPNVLKAVGYDPKTVQGFAFGMGVDRMAMLLYGIDDIRHFNSTNIKILEQF